MLCSPAATSTRAVARSTQMPPTTEWEMTIDYTEEATTNHEETRQGGYDRVNAHQRISGHASVVLLAVPDGAGVKSVKTVSIQGSGTYEATRTRRFKTVTPYADSGKFIIETIDEDSQSSGTFDPAAVKLDDFSFVVSVIDKALRENRFLAAMKLQSTLVGVGTLPYRLHNVAKSKRLILNTAGQGEPRETSLDNTTTSGVLCSATGAVTDAMVEARNFSVSQTVTDPIAREAQLGAHETSTVRIDVHPLGPKEPLDLIVQPDGYDAWLPEGSLSAPGSVGNSITIRATLKTKAGKPLPPDQLPNRMSFRIGNVSQEPGVAMNAPVNAPADTKPDLRIDKSNNAGDLRILDDNGQTAEHVGSDTSATVVVSAYDYGAYGDITVTADLADGRTITGHVTGKAPGPVLLPKRDPSSKIADAWKQQNGAAGRSDSADDDEQPAGNGFDGDGFTLYEEYRGFVSNGAHIRTDPTVKDVFIVNRIGASAATGIGYFTTGSSLAVHADLLQKELPDSGVLNGNHAAGPHHVDQHAIVLASSTGGKDEAEEIGTPGKVRRVFVGPQAPGAGARATTERDASIAHELLHSCNVQHHGSGDRIPVTWVKSPTGSLIERAMELNGEAADKPITLKSETGAALTVHDPIVAGLFPDGGSYSIGLYVAAWNGEHSGVEDCVMRYSVSILEPSGVYVTIVADHLDPSIRYVIAQAEKVGTGLCDRPTGTGVNAAGRRPLRWHGDAQTKGCKGQICVNDAYAGR